MDLRGLCGGESFIDTTVWIKTIVQDSRWNVLASEAGSGKTTLLAMLYYFLEETEDSKAFFADKKITRNWPEWEKYVNHYRVFCC